MLCVSLHNARDLIVSRGFGAGAGQDDHVVARSPVQVSDDHPQPPLQPVAHHGATDLLADREADAGGRRIGVVCHQLEQRVPCSTAVPHHPGEIGSRPETFRTRARGRVLGLVHARPPGAVFALVGRRRLRWDGVYEPGSPCAGVADVLDDADCPRGVRLDRQAGSTALPAASNHLPPARGGHPRAEAQLALPGNALRLPGTLHRCSDRMVCSP